MRNNDDKVAQFIAGKSARLLWPAPSGPRDQWKWAYGFPERSKVGKIRRLTRRSKAAARVVAKLISVPTIANDILEALLRGETGNAKHMAMTTLRRAYIHSEKIVSRKYGFLWISNSKVASRSITAALFDADPDAEVIFNRSVLDVYKIYPEVKGYYSFAFVRHPFDRAISYHTQLHHLDKSYKGEILTRKERDVRLMFTSYYGLGKTAHFHDYCQWLNTPYGSDAFADHHFRSQYLVVRLGHDRLPDFIGRIESLQEDFHRVVAHVGMPTPRIPMLNTAAGWTTTPDALRARRSKMNIRLTECSKVLLRKRYAKDFQLGSYSSL